MKSKLGMVVGGVYVLMAEYMRWWTVENTSMFRWVFATAATLFGAFIVYASLPRRAAR